MPATSPHSPAMGHTPKIQSPFSSKSSLALTLARAEPVAGDQELIPPPHTVSLLSFLLWKSS